jgi:hypothetical protein
MKKKLKSSPKKAAKKIIKKTVNKLTKTSLQKVTVGEDEFCPTCMEWRQFDEMTGKCKVCGRLIKKGGSRRPVTDEYDLKDFTIEHDEQQDTSEN